ncbi:hypothetical protein APSETT444_005075 [Aspergillus pseudonomiae]
MSEPEILRLISLEPRPIEGFHRAIIRLESLKPLNIIHQHADPIRILGDIRKLEYDVLSRRDQRSPDYGEDTSQLRAVEQSSCCLEDAVEAPSCDAVNEQTDQEALTEDVVVDSEVHVWYDEKGDDAAGHDAVYRQHSGESALIAEGEGLG